MDSEDIISQGKKTLIVTFIAAILIVAAVSVILKQWVVFGIPVGLLFGFFLQKGDLCGSSAFSEVILMKDYSKVFGLWIGIVVTMAGIALLDILDLIALNPKPFLFLNMIIGGIVFGAGTVLAGGCVSGCLYKAGSGNLNSMAALAGIPIGIAMIEFGPLSGMQAFLKTHVIKPEIGKSITLSSLTGTPFWILAMIIAFLTVLAVFYRYKNKKSVKPVSSEGKYSITHKIFIRSWKPWQAGIAIGLLVIPAYLSSASSGRNYPLGVTHGVLQAELLFIDKNFNHVWENSSPVTTSNTSNRAIDTSIQPVRQQPQGKKIVWWLVLLVSSMIVGSFVSGKLSGQAILLPKPPEQTVTAFFGGILVGSGAAIGGGCVIGNILSGWALMSVGTIVFGVFTISANWGVTFLYLMGGAGSKNSKL
ncbi:YeeE/YedE family protein [candidate division KSB1 bacterium]